MNSLSGTFSTSSFTGGHSMEGHKEPYELVIDKTLRSRAKRIQDDTREELSKVLERVENTLVEYERSVHPQRIEAARLASSSSASTEYMVDINDLEEILSDKIAKFKVSNNLLNELFNKDCKIDPKIKYKQQITVFIVGQCEAIDKKNYLLNQINDFFTDQTANLDPSQIKVTEFEFNLDDVKEEMDDCLETAKLMGTRLEEINESIIQYLIAQTSSKQAKALIERSRKKLEKSIKDAKDEISSMNERLKVAQTELNIRDERIQSLIKQVEIKANDIAILQKKLAGKATDGVVSTNTQGGGGGGGTSSTNQGNMTSSNEQATGETNAENSNNATNEINLLKSKTKKMELEIKLLRRKLAKAGVEGSEQQTVEQLMEEAKAELATSGGSGGGGAAPTNAAIDDQEKKTGDENAEDDAMNKELSEFEVKELDLLKYKHEQDVNALKKEYGEQLDVVTNRLKQAEAELQKLKKAKSKV